MKKGNKRFYSGKREDHNFLAQQRASAKGQYPAAILLTCIDSRAPAETILDLRIGDIFNSRVAGNVENRYPWQYGVRLQTGWGQGSSGHGPYGVRCNQGRY